MGHPVIDEFARSQTLQEWFLRNCQRDFPKLYNNLEAERDRLALENVDLKAQVTTLELEITRLTSLAKRRGVSA